MRIPITEACKTRYLLADGGISITLRRMVGDGAATAERLNLDQPATVLQMHEDFIDAGADCVTTNSFGANATRMADMGRDSLHKICEEAARLARQAAGPDRYVLGSVGPWYKTGDNWEDAFARQVRTLADGGVDAIVIETVTSLEAARKLCRLAKANDSKLPVFVSFSFKKTGNSFMLAGDGATLDEVGDALESIDAEGYGVNCGSGLDIYDYATLVSHLRESTETCIIARPSAGDPHGDEAGLPTYPDEPEFMAEGVWGTVRAGANIIGGCCGVTPDHIRAFKMEMDMLG